MPGGPTKPKTYSGVMITFDMGPLGPRHRVNLALITRIWAAPGHPSEHQTMRTGDVTWRGLYVAPA